MFAVVNSTNLYKKSSWIVVLFTGMLAIVATPVSAGATDQFERAKSLYYQGVEGNKDATRASINLLESLNRERREDPLTLAYLSSNYLLESGRSFAPWKKYQLAKAGILGLDQAVAQVPDNLEVRFVRAASTWHLPSIFHREKQCEEDLEYLASRVKKAAEAGSFEKRLAAVSLYYSGLLKEKKGDRAQAVRFWKEAVEVAPDSRAGRQSAEKLK